MSAPLLPPALWEQIAAFLAAGHTGRVEIAVRRGRIVGYTVAATWPVEEPEPPVRLVAVGAPSAPPARRVQSER